MRYLIIFLSIISVSAIANYAKLEKAPSEQAIYFYPDKKKKKVKTGQVVKPHQIPYKYHPQKMTQEQRCHNPNTWDSGCGFVDPGTNFQFEQKEMREILQQFFLSSSSHNTYAYNKFINWMIMKATAAAYASQFNRMQHPELNLQATSPISEFGIHMFRNLSESKEKDYFKSLSKTAFLTFFTRHGQNPNARDYCPVCQQMAPIYKLLSEDTGIPIYEASLDTAHFNGFKYHTAPGTLMPARALQVKVVPTLFIYLKPNSDGFGSKWIRVSIGAEDKDTIKQRILQYVEAMHDTFRKAVAKGMSVAQANKQTPDFSSWKSDYLATHGTATDQ